MKVLIATDGSKEATTALKTADRLLVHAGRNLDLLCVASKRRWKSPGTVHKNGYEQHVLRQMTQILERARTTLGPNGGTIRLLSEIGSPSSSIVGRAEDYDLTVIGAKDRSPGGEAGLGPVASRVAEHTIAPVLVARELRSDDSLRVLVALDGSTASFHAVETLGALIDLTSAEVCLMHVVETPWFELGLEEDWVTYSEEDKEHSEAGALEEEVRLEGEAIIEQARDMLRMHRVSISTRIEEGNPSDQILGEAERGQYDLVVAGAVGVRDLKHVMLGSVSSKICWNAPCSVLLVRELE